MTGLVRKATLLVVLGLVAASSAMAGIPSPANSTVPAYFDVYGCKTSVPDPLNAVNAATGFLNKVTIRDIGNFPVVNCLVTLTFCGDVKLYNAVPGHPELIVSCSPSAISATTDLNGVAQFYLVGATINTNGVAAGTGAGCITINACGVPFGTATATVFDENGAVGTKGVEGTDLSAWLGDFGKKGVIGYKGRSDYNHSGTVEGTDLSIWLKVFGLGNSAQSCGTLCP